MGWGIYLFTFGSFRHCLGYFQFATKQTLSSIFGHSGLVWSGRRAKKKTVVAADEDEIALLHSRIYMHDTNSVGRWGVVK